MDARLLALLLALFRPAALLASQDELGGGGDADDGHDLADKLFDCRFKLSKLPTHFLQLSLHHLLLEGAGETVGEAAGETSSAAAEEPNLAQLNRENSLDQLHFSRLDPHLPFVFFINGFNNYGAVNSTWMYSTARVLARHFSGRRRRQDRADKLASSRPEINNNDDGRRANFVILSWQISGLFATDVLTMPIAYYRTMANYDEVVEAVERAMARLIDFVEARRRPWSLPAQQTDYYSSFRFYGHSLGSHILAHALHRVRQARPEVGRFGLLVGLDPALPCFVSENYGIGRARQQNTTAQVVVIHSNAALLGTHSRRADVEVVLNGGTFQPDCSYLSLECHHARAIEIFGYSDQHCQMVAYRCSKLEQFKLGACETCEPGSLQSDCFVLVNLPEQHEASEEVVIKVNNGNETRHLADNQQVKKQVKVSSSKKRPTRNRLPPDDQLYYVNTDPDFKQSGSHCLQHYQLRLLVIQVAGDQGDEQRCPLSSFSLTGADDELRILLFSEIGYANRHQPPLSADIETHKSLREILKDKLYTSLINHRGPPRLYVGALLDSLDLEAWSSCLAKLEQNAERRLYKFVLDIAFMSNVNHSIRHAYSSVLCAQWDPMSLAAFEGELELSLCRQAELADVSFEIDEYLQLKPFTHQTDSWQVTLLDSLFSLYVEWEPFKR